MGQFVGFLHRLVSQIATWGGGGWGGFLPKQNSAFGRSLVASLTCKRKRFTTQASSTSTLKSLSETSLRPRTRASGAAMTFQEG